MSEGNGVNRTWSVDPSLIGLAIVAGQLGIGGAEQQLFYVLENLDRNRFRPVVITLGPSAEEHWVTPIRGLDVPVYHVPRSWNRVERVVQIAQTLRSQRIVMIHSWHFHTNPYAVVAGRLAGVPVRLGYVQESYQGIGYNKLLRTAALFGLDALVVNSQTAAQLIQTHRLAKVPIRVLPNGVPVPETILAVDRERVRADLGCRPTDVILGSIGRLDSNKNHAMLLRVFGEASSRLPNLRLVIIGDGPERPRLGDMVDKLRLQGRVLFAGPIPQAARLLSAMDVFCLTSYAEGMPNVVMEASAFGVPIVATRCGGTTEVVEDGATGYLVEPDDDRLMLARIMELLTNPEQRQKMGQAGRIKMQAEFTVDLMVRRLRIIYDEVLSAKGVR